MDSVVYRQMWDHDRDPFLTIETGSAIIFSCSIEMEIAFVFGHMIKIYGLMTSHRN